jgi:hypothetical protein
VRQPPPGSRCPASRRARARAGFPATGSNDGPDAIGVRHRRKVAGCSDTVGGTDRPGRTPEICSPGESMGTSSRSNLRSARRSGKALVSAVSVSVGIRAAVLVCGSVVTQLDPQPPALPIVPELVWHPVDRRGLLGYEAAGAGLPRRISFPRSSHTGRQRRRTLRPGGAPSHQVARHAHRPAGRRDHARDRGTGTGTGSSSCTIVSGSSLITASSAARTRPAGVPARRRQRPARVIQGVRVHVQRLSST